MPPPSAGVIDCGTRRTVGQLFMLPSFTICFGSPPPLKAAAPAALGAVAATRLEEIQVRRTIYFVLMECILFD